jgi:hypothetical protein
VHQAEHRILPQAIQLMEARLLPGARRAQIQ